jgi:GTP cyclohydrolase I
VPSLSQIVEIADRLFPFHEAEPWDNCGIQIGDPDRSVNAIAFSLDPSPPTVHFAADHNCQLLITHHPVLLEPIRNILPDSVAGKTLLCAGRMGVDILSLHTNLDAASGGLNDEMAKVLGLEAVATPLGAPCARMGNLANPLSIDELAEKVRQAFGLSQLRLVGGRRQTVQKVFCVSGSGMGYLKEAKKNHADVMVTGDVRYHAARDAEDVNIAVIDAGHFGIERIAIPLMARSFQAQFREIGFDVKCFSSTLEEEPFVEMRYP